MVESLFTGGVGIYVFYALQPYLLELYGDPQAYTIAGLVAAIVAGAQILGGMAAPRIRGRFRRRTSALIADRGPEHADPRADRPFRPLLAGDRPHRCVGTAVRGLDADSADVHERSHPVAAAGDDPLLRLADGLRPAGSWAQPVSAARPTFGDMRRPTVIGADLCACCAVPPRCPDARMPLQDTLDLSELPAAAQPAA